MFKGKQLPDSKLLLPTTIAPTLNIKIVAISFLFFTLFFIDGPEYEAARSFKAFWDLGHIAVFALWSYCLAKEVKFLADQKFLNQAALLLVFSLSVGISIELLQGSFQRTSSVEDIVRDIIGTLVALVFLAQQQRYLYPKNILRFYQISTAFLVIAALFPFVRAISDEYLARKNFPLLSNLENPFEISRWECNADCSIVTGFAQDKGRSLKILLDTKLYSGVLLKYFPHDWRNFGYVNVNIFNESDEPLMITCRIDDRKHRARGNKYNDRFNRSLILSTGWNRIKIPLADVAYAPEDRKMDMGEIINIGFFVTKLKKRVNIYVDDLRLSN